MVIMALVVSILLDKQLNNFCQQALFHQHTMAAAPLTLTIEHIRTTLPLICSSFGRGPGGPGFCVLGLATVVLRDFPLSVAGASLLLSS